MRARLAAMCLGDLGGTAMGSPWNSRSTRSWVGRLSSSVRSVRSEQQFFYGDLVVIMPWCGVGHAKCAGIKQRSDVLALGIDKYNEECRSIVMT